jgi:hypothetical protein
VTTADILAKARSRTVVELFTYFYALRHKRAPRKWEVIIAEALLTGQLTIQRPPDHPALRAVYYLVDSVELALSLADFNEETPE